MLPLSTHVQRRAEKFLSTFLFPSLYPLLTSRILGGGLNYVFHF